MCRDITDSPGEGVRGSGSVPRRRELPERSGGSVLSYTSGRRRR